MSKRRNKRGAAARTQPHTSTATGPPWRVLAALGVVVLLVAGALLAYRATLGPSGEVSAANVALHSKGPADAPVTITEWGDFQ